MNSEIEKCFVKNFILPHKRERALLELSDTRRRERFIFNLQKYLDRSAFHPLKETQASGICAALQAAGAGASCYLISTDEEKDGREFPLQTGIQNLDYEYDILICSRGNLAYYREDCNWKGYILTK